MKEINIFLAEGLECKDLIRAKNKQLLYLDSLETAREKQLANTSDQLTLKSGEVSLLELQRNECFDEVHKADLKTEKAEKRKRTWRAIVFIEAGVIATILLLK